MHARAQTHTHTLSLNDFIDMKYKNRQNKSMVRNQNEVAWVKWGKRWVID